MSDQLQEGRQLTKQELEDARKVLVGRLPANLTWEVDKITDLSMLTWGEEMEWFACLDRELMCADPTDWDKLATHVTKANFVNGAYYMWALVNKVDPRTATRVIWEMQRMADENTRTE